MATNSKIVAAMADNDWQAESDARTLCSAIEIRKDKVRLKAAVDYAKAKSNQYKTVVTEAAEDEIDNEGDEE